MKSKIDIPKNNEEAKSSETTGTKRKMVTSKNKKIKKVATQVLIDKMTDLRISRDLHVEQTNSRDIKNVSIQVINITDNHSNNKTLKRKNNTVDNNKITINTTETKSTITKKTYKEEWKCKWNGKEYHQKKKN